MKKLGGPTTVKLEAGEEAFISELQAKTGVNKSELIRRAVRYAGPLFLSGEVNLLTLLREDRS